MAKKRGGLGRGIGALIPSAPTSAPQEDLEPAPNTGVDAAPAEPEKQRPTAAGEARESELSQEAASEEPDATPQGGGRPVDMFFSSDSARSTVAEAPLRQRSDLADEWARDTQSKRRSAKAASPKSAATTPEEAPASAAKNGTEKPTVEAPQKAETQAQEPGNGDIPDSPPIRSEGDLMAVPGAQFAEIPINEIRENPRNPRTVFDEDELNELAYSLREVGVLQPVVVRPVNASEGGESFELVMGERRWRAAKRAGLPRIPAIIRDTTDDDLLRDALLENLHRAQLNPLEEAAAYGQLLEDFGCTQEELSDKIGRSRPQISNTLRLLRLPPLVQRRLASGAISAGHARALLGIDDDELQEELAQRIVNEGLSVRAVERLIANGASPNSGMRQSAPRRSSYNPHVVDMTSKLANRLEAPVRIDVGKRKGKITLEFTNLDDLDRLLEKLGVDLEDL